MPDPTPAAPRWILTVTPIGGGEANVQIVVNAEDVVQGEVVFALLRVAQQFAARPGQRLPTQEEVKAAATRQELVTKHPARRIFATGSGAVFLGDEAMANTPLMDELRGRGWTDVGVVPADVARACEWAVDPEAFRARYLAAPPTPEA